MRTRRHASPLVVAALALLALTAGRAIAADRPLDTLLADLQLVRLDGRPAPPFALERLSDGQRVSLAEHRGRPVLLYFWATW
jgi:cytochrome oxidase Cu insertion factor (SCO1/SenC/PrrC family)